MSNEKYRIYHLWCTVSENDQIPHHEYPEVIWPDSTIKTVRYINLKSFFFSLQKSFNII